MRQEERRARTIARVMGAAKAAFARGGYAETSLDRIASDAGVSKGAVSAYYPTKLDLFLAVTDQVLGDARVRLGRVAAAVERGELPLGAARRYLGAPDDNEHVSLMAEIWRMATAWNLCGTGSMRSGGSAALTSGLPRWGLEALRGRPSERRTWSRN